MYMLYILYIYTIYIPHILRTTLCDLLYDFTYHSLSHGLIGSIIVHATSTNSLSSALSSYNTYLIRSVTLASSSSPLSLKISVISKLSIRGTVPSFLFAFILLSSEVILLYSRCLKKGLIYVAIAAPSSRQPSSCSKCTSINIQSSYDVRLVSNVKYIFYIRLCLCSVHSSNKNI